LNDEKVKKYFEQIADEFDNIYDNKGSFSTRITNKVFRKSMRERVPATIKECDQLQNKTVLDIGCSSGRISFLLAKEGTIVTGIDYSNRMIELAKTHQKQLNQSNLEFLCCDFIQDFSEDKKFDIFPSNTINIIRSCIHRSYDTFFILMK